MREDERNFMQMNWKHWKLRSAFTGLSCAVCFLAAVLAGGCGSSKPSSSSSGGNFANPPAPAQYNNYAGTQTYEFVNPGIGSETGGVWNVTLDDTNNFFTYTDVSIPPLTFSGPSLYPLEGATKPAGSFLKLTLNGKSSGSGGYAIEIPGRLAVLRPGDTSTLPVVAAQASTTSCQELPQNTTFEFMSLAHPYISQDVPYVAYGSVQASSSGKAWTFSNLQMFLQDGTALSVSMPSSGLCSYTNEGYVTSILPDKSTQNLPWTVVVGSSGYLVIDQGQGNGPQYDGPEAGNQTIGPYGLVGFPQPSSQIDTGSLVSGKYIGFTYAPYNGPYSRPVTQPVAFSGGSGTVAVGGLYPNDDVTQTPPSNISLDLGPEDSSTNGLYKSVTVTMPDTYSACVSQPYGGTDANGNPTCIAHGIAIAGTVEGKYVLYAAVLDHSLDTRNAGGYPVLEYLLYQQ